MGGDRRRVHGTRGGDLVPSRALALTILTAAVLIVASPFASASAHRAGIVVDDAQGHTHVKCIAFDTRTITGLELLQRSGFPVGVQQAAIGAEVCNIFGGGCSSTTNCFCHYPKFWGYWTRAPDATKWRFSDVGAQARVVTDRSVDAWVWGKDGGPAPKVISFDQLCAAGGGSSGTSKTSTNYGEFAIFITGLAVVVAALAVRRARRSKSAGTR